MTKPNTSSAQQPPQLNATRLPTHDQIAALAFQLYEDSGEVEGRDQENWFQAEALLREPAAPAMILKNLATFKVERTSEPQATSASAEAGLAGNRPASANSDSGARPRPRSLVRPSLREVPL